MGIPMIIAVPNGEATKIISDTNSGLVVPPEDPESLAKAIRSLKDSRTYQILSKSSQEAASDYDRKRLAINMLENIEEVVEK